jgi:hypothetical protein
MIRLVGHIDATLGEHIPDVTVAQSEAKIEPDGLRDESLSISERYTVRPSQDSVTVTVPGAEIRPFCASDPVARFLRPVAMVNWLMATRTKSSRLKHERSLVDEHQPILPRPPWLLSIRRLAYVEALPAGA